MQCAPPSRRHGRPPELIPCLSSFSDLPATNSRRKDHHAAPGERAAPGFAGLAIGLTLVAIHLVGIQVTGVSVNPARSFGPAILVGGTALAQLWLSIVAPLAGGVLGGLLYRFKILKV